MDLARLNPPWAGQVVRLVSTAVLAYLLAVLLLPAPAPLLAPLTALLVVQVSSYKTIMVALRRVVAVTVGVIVALALAGLLGFSWWSLGITIASGLIIGNVLRLGDQLLEVPISAMLILQIGAGDAATDRVYETLIGAAVGLLARLLTAPVRVRTAENALRDLGGSMAALLDSMADGMETAPDPQTVHSWLDRARDLADQRREVDDVLTEAEESARFNPRATVVQGPATALWSALQTLDYATVTMRALANSLADRTGLQLRDRSGLGKEMWEADVRARLAGTLRELARAAAAYTAAATAPTAGDAAALAVDLQDHLARGRNQRGELGTLLRDDPGHWPLHGELLVHLDRLLDGLGDDLPAITRRPLRRRIIG